MVSDSRLLSFAQLTVHSLTLYTEVFFFGMLSYIWHTGPRRTGEGTEDEEQGIIAADSTATG